MGRPYAKLFRDIWADKDFCALDPEARYVYLFVISQPDLNAAGVLALTVRRWAARLGITVAAVEAALELLHIRGYVVMDVETEELLVRTFIRNDGLWRIPNTLYAVVRDAERTVSPTLRATLAAELGSLPVDELSGKRSAEMKAQVSTVVATLGATVEPTEEPRSGMRVRVRDEGAGGTSGSSGTAVNQSSQRYARDDLTDLIQQEIRKATGRDITAELAATIGSDLLGSREVSDPAAYVTAAIRGERNPRERFLPVTTGHPSARTPAEAAFAAGIVPNGTPARGETVASIAAKAREAITDATRSEP
jgi:hypothetical protein